MSDTVTLVQIYVEHCDTGKDVCSTLTLAQVYVENSVNGKFIVDNMALDRYLLERMTVGIVHCGHSDTGTDLKKTKWH
jgi:hypothetical protein